jgi:hypothetical protein
MPSEKSKNIFRMADAVVVGGRARDILSSPAHLKLDIEFAGLMSPQLSQAWLQKGKLKRFCPYFERIRPEMEPTDPTFLQ